MQRYLYNSVLQDPRESPAFEFIHGWSDLRSLLHPIHLFDFIAHAVRNQITLELPIHRQHAIVNRKRFRRDAKSADLLVVRQLRIYCIQSLLDLFPRWAAGDNGGKISAAIPDDD